MFSDSKGNIREEVNNGLNIEQYVQDKNWGDKVFQSIMETEGECKILKYQFLRVNYLKGILLTFLLTLSVFGLIFLKYKIMLRVFVFYNKSNIDEATHVLFFGQGQEERQISSFQNGHSTYLKLSYRFDTSKSKFIPISYIAQLNYQKISSQNYQKNGLSEQQVEQKVKQYGLNQHKVEIQGLFQFILSKLIDPFYIIQYIYGTLYIVLTDFDSFGGFLLFLIFLSSSINYILIYLSCKDIKQLAQKQFEVSVIRSGVTQKILNTQVVPGDIFVPQGQIMCDALVLKGDVFVNQANLTGESHPIGKFPMKAESIYESEAWIYEGSYVLETSTETLAIAINTGFTTKRGRIIRRILTREENQLQIFKSALIFFVENSILSFVAFGIYLALVQQNKLKMTDSKKIFMFFDILSAFIPSPIAFFFSLNYSFSLGRLKLKKIYGTSFYKTVEGALTNVMFFDKTGTITQSEVKLKKIFHIQKDYINNDIMREIFSNGKEDYQMILNILATCHTTRKINNEFVGDEIDKEIFIFSKHKLTENKSKDAIITIESQEGNILEILKFNQFESRFQSMSVLVRDACSKKVYAFIKGAPEKIFNNSLNRPHRFYQTVESLSLGGYRTIAIGYKEIGEDFIEKYQHSKRKIYEKDVIILGLLAFQNKIKDEAKETMERLKESSIKAKMITGDNIYIAIDTAIKSGILEKNKKVVILEGKNQRSEKQNRIFRGKLLEKTDTFVNLDEIFIKEKEEYESLNYEIAVDNEFLSLDPQPKIVNKILIFARILPEKKASIIKSIKNQYIQEHQVKGFFYNLTNGDRPKVGICGDGANDLLALRQADLSVGIQKQNASYAASFTINKLTDIDEVIRESKNNISNIGQVFMYLVVTSIASKVITITLATNAVKGSSMSRFTFSIASLLLFPFLFPFNKPTENPSPKTPISSFMNLYSQLVIWGNIVILSFTIIISYVFFQTTDQFQKVSPSLENPEEVDQTGSDATVMFLIVNLLWASTFLAIYWGDPWKVRLYQNCIIFPIFLIDLVVGIVFFFTTEKISKTFEFKEISNETSASILGIVLAGTFLQQIYNLILHKCVNNTQLFSEK